MLHSTLLNFCKMKSLSLSFVSHCSIGLLIRLVLIGYANFHDKFFTVPYTDIDYKVFSDAARLITEGKSPFDRHTYRYSPILALILIPNEYLHHDFGKVLFSFIDIFITVLIKYITIDKKLANMCAYLWLYNPLAIVISTRGNADSISALLVLSTIFAMQRNHYIIAGLIHGLSIHFRLYPLVFSMSLYLSLKTKSYLIPNLNQLKLVISCIFALGFLTAVNYLFYGYQFLYESLIYHLIRKDSRHNFSVYFYMLYLSANIDSSLLEKICVFLPQLVLLIAISILLSDKNALSFGLFMQAMIMVIYNPVLTSQYFFWFLSLLPICFPVMGITTTRCVILLGSWLGSQGLWLFCAYLLEFQGLNTFVGIWIASLVFFIVNVKIVVDICTFVKLIM